MSVGQSLPGQELLLRQLRKYGEQAVREAERVIARTANDARNTAVDGIVRGSATGTVYTLTDPNRVHQASSPEEFPANDTGTLASSIKVEVNGLSAFIGTSVDYGAWLEFGTQNMEPREWLRPSVEGAAKTLEQRMIKAIESIRP